MATSTNIPLRSEVPEEHRWNLSRLCKDEQQWESYYSELQSLKPKISSFQGTLGHSATSLRSALDFQNEINSLLERLGCYVLLRMAEDGTNSDHQGRNSRFKILESECGSAMSFFKQEIMSISDSKLDTFLAEDELQPFRFFIEQIRREKSHLLSEAEERILELQKPFSGVSQDAFMTLIDVDFTFEDVNTPEGKQILNQVTYRQLLQHPNHEVRKESDEKYLDTIDAHKNTIMKLFNGAIQKDVFEASLRGYSSSCQKRLSQENISTEVYDNLIAVTHNFLPSLHKYYRLRQKVIGVETLHSYDLKIPLIKEVNQSYSYEEAVDLLSQAVNPLGTDYSKILRHGLLEGWVDRYSNQGKSRGAFCVNPHHGDPYVLMNYNNDLDSMFVLAHEFGHAMHGYYSSQNNPFHYSYFPRFVAEVPSACNELLLAHYITNTTTSREVKTFMIYHQIESIVNSFYRQVQFAEFEKKIHETVENKQALTVDFVCQMYFDILQQHYGENVQLNEREGLKCLIIRHFYFSFYVYTYAVGMAAAIALTQNIINNPDSANSYLNFLKLGGSCYSLEQLKLAGVDMTTPEPIEKALQHFDSLVTELENLL